MERAQSELSSRQATQHSHSQSQEESALVLHLSRLHTPVTGTHSSYSQYCRSPPFSTARYPSIRMLVALAAHYDWELHHMDVKSAYLNGDLDEEIYMEQPEGAAIPGKQDYVCRLRKSLYGLKQAGRTWHHKINRALQQRGFIPLESDHCVYVRKQNTSIIIIALYVDDLLLAASELKELRSFKQDLTREFEMEDLGEATFILGIEILRDRKRRAITITQTAYINTLLERHGHADAYCTATPMESDAHHVKAPTTYQANTSTIREYQSIIGGIMFAMLCTRPDIAFAVATLSKFAQNPSPAHMAGVRRVLRYLRATDKLGIRYASTDPPTQHPQLLGYTDSDWAADRDDRKSISGYAFVLCGGAISWQAKKQQTAALSTVEAEYLAAAAAAKEALWWRNQLAGLGHDMSQPTTLLVTTWAPSLLPRTPFITPARNTSTCGITSSATMWRSVSFASSISARPTWQPTSSPNHSAGRSISSRPTYSACPSLPHLVRGEVLRNDLSESAKRE